MKFSFLNLLSFLLFPCSPLPLSSPPLLSSALLTVSSLFSCVVCFVFFGSGFGIQGFAHSRQGLYQGIMLTSLLSCDFFSKVQWKSSHTHGQHKTKRVITYLFCLCIQSYSLWIFFSYSNFSYDYYLCIIILVYSNTVALSGKVIFQIYKLPFSPDSTFYS